MSCAAQKDIGQSEEPANVETIPVNQAQLKVDEELQLLREPLISSFTIEPGDRLNINVYGEPELSSVKTLVRQDGNITVKLVGLVHVAGKTLEQSQSEIEELLSEYIYYPKVTVEPVTLKKNQFTIIGKVVSPGVYQFDETLSAISAIGIAGGLAIGTFDEKTVELADLEHSYIKRGNRLLPVNFEALVTRGDMNHNIQLHDHDYIYIASSINQEVYILGEVNQPGYFGYSSRLTLARLLSRAEGRLPSAGGEALVIRGNINTPMVFKVDIDGILHGDTADFPIKPNDVVYIPRSGIGAWNNFIEQLLPTIQSVLSGFIIESYLYNQSLRP